MNIRSLHIILLLIISTGIVPAQMPQFVPLSQYIGIQEVESTADLYGQGAAAADIDNDGDIDLLYEQKKQDDECYFEEVAKISTVDASGWDWGTTFIDINKGEVTVHIYDIAGRVSTVHTVPKVERELEYEFDPLVPGVYVCQVTMGDTTQHFKLIKQN